MNGYMIVGSAVVGLLVGLTGAGGGALMTPMLILAFSVRPSAAVSSDLVAAVVMRPVGAAVHFGRRTLNLRLAGWVTAGAVPGALAGSYVFHVMASSRSASAYLEHALGVALLLGASGMAIRALLDRMSGAARDGDIGSLRLRPAPTVAVGALGGLVVGMTSVGAGSLMIVLLLFLYPGIGPKQLVGTDLAQAIPLTAAAALGALAFGNVELSLTASVVVGSVPAVLVGSLLSSRLPDRLLQATIFCVVLASGLNYVGAGTHVLLAAVAMAAAVMAYAALMGRRRSAPAAAGRPEQAVSTP